MPRPFVLSLSEADPELREAIARALGDAAEGLVSATDEELKKLAEESRRDG